MNISEFTVSVNGLTGLLMILDRERKVIPKTCREIYQA
jgi:hypothetical protein